MRYGNSLRTKRPAIRPTVLPGAAFAVLACTLLALLPASAPADELVLAADAWCPFSCEPGTDDPGFIVELARLAFAAEGHEVIYEIAPWSRAIEGAHAGRYTAIMGAIKEEAPDFVYPETEAAVISEQCFVLEGSAWRYAGLESLGKIRLGVIQGYSYGPVIDEYVAAHGQDAGRVFVATGEKPLLRLARMLEHGRIDVLIESAGVMNFLMTDDETVADMVPAGVVNEVAVYIAFAPGREESAVYAAIFDRAVGDLRSSGVLDALAKKYGIKQP